MITLLLSTQNRYNRRRFTKCLGECVVPPPISTIEGLVWPGLPGRYGQGLLSLLYQLEQSQWWTPEELRRHQFRQLGALLRHAMETVPFYRGRLADAGVSRDAGLTPEAWSRIPVLARAEVQGTADGLLSGHVPKAHGRQNEVFTSGSTGTPVRVVKTALTQMFWDAFTLRDHLWHRRDVSGKLAAIREPAKGGAAYPDGIQGKAWSRAAAAAFPPGPAAMLDIGAKVHQQAEWLQRQDPDYLLTFPSNLKALAQYFIAHDMRLSGLKQVMTTSELLYPDVRAACRTAWGASVSDMYTAEEVGYMAMQCREHGSYHIQSEAALVEVLDDAGRPCAPGDVGQVVVTPLHNFAMPLIRYAVGDLARAGGTCPCGRGLPVLKRVLGRVRSMVRLANGEQHYPIFQDLLKGIDPVIQFQIVRRGEEGLEMKLVATRELTEAEAAELTRQVHDCFQFPFAVAFTYHDEIPRGPGGKFQDYVP